ncbi:site-specific DNA-methyltransferase [Pseudomonas sp. D2002]|uniref:site-specific DNA-methyltransferase n=1 Tax=Pseudomonas sp. D2002 TaxID=2726980 RepID=UPI0015A3B6C5|nr:site-specific DNA-methyltransferase [Pseudomonas sp. D2002]NWA85069.1 site-specific DNA-methyltransferase [Pseudomonas sp. D2002]
MADNYDDYSREQLLRLIRERDRAPRLGLVWERDEIDHDLSVNNDFVALDWDEKLSCGDGPQQNLIIEGDNFDALRTLRMTHAGRVKGIYIDPPYNTGNRDFIYNDRFIDKDDNYRHTKWLEFMFRRLELAKELLAEDGVIFVSIDDNEVFHLGLLMEQVFGEKNCLAKLIWQTDGNFDNQARFKVCHEYVLVYAVAESQVGAPPTIDPNAEETGKLFRDVIRNTIVKNGPKNPVSEIHLPAGFPADFESGTIPARIDKWPHFLSDAVIEDGKLSTAVIVKSGWANKHLCERFIATGFAPVWDTKNQLTTFKLTSTGAIENVKVRSENQSHVISVIKNVGSVQSSGADLLAQGIDFTYPKPVGLIKYLISMIEDKNALVLDFFAGSGTTGQAVLELNAEDGGNRNFILVSNTEATPDLPTKNICRDVCAKRVSQAVTGYQRKKGGTVAALGGSFAYLRCRRVPAANVFRSIQHTQIWTALQLIHEVPLTLYKAASSLQIAQGKRGLFIYVPKISETVLDLLKTAISSAPEAVIYSWQPALLAQRLYDPRISFEPIPAFLVNRFGARSTAKGGRS